MYFVIEDIGTEASQPDGLLIGDEVDIVPFVRKGLSQFGCQDTAPPESRITYDPNIHGGRLLVK